MMAKIFVRQFLFCRQQMALNLKVFAKNYKLRTTSYKVKGISHDGISLRATMAPYYKCGEKNGIINYLCYKFGKGVFHGYDKEDSRYAGGVFHDIPGGVWCDVPSR